MRTIQMKATERVEVLKPLEQYCCTNYGKEQWENVRSFIEIFSSLRENVCSIQGRTASEGQLGLLRRYLAMCTLLEQRFPFGEAEGMVNVKFKWADSFKPENKAVLSSMLLEKASVVYNIAAIQCNMGLHADRSSREACRGLINHFTMSAAIFSFVRDQCIAGITEIGTVDLSPAALNLHVLMLQAQAQAVFYDKAVSEKCNRSLLSKLAYQIAHYYNGALDYASKLSNLIPSGLAIWFRTQELSYLAAAHYQKVMDEKTEVERKSEGYGILISRLRLANRLLNEAESLISQHSLQINLQLLASTVRTELSTREKDNVQIYLEAVPDEGKLPTLEAVSAAKLPSVSLKDLCDYNEMCVQAFDRLVPDHVRSRLDEYHMRCQSILRSIQGQIATQQAEISAYLTDKDLPFVVLADQNALPEHLWNNIQDLQAKGGLAAIEETSRQLVGMADEARRQIDRIESGLDREKELDENCRKHFGKNWQRPSSQDLNQNFLSSVSNYKIKLEQAVAANRSVGEKIRQCSIHQKYLTSSREILQSLIPVVNSIVKDTPQKQRVRATLTFLEAAIQRMNAKTEELRTLMAGENITSGLMQARRIGEPFDRVVEREIDKYEEPTRRIEQLIADSKAHLQCVDRAWKEYKTLADSTTDPRTHFLRGLENSVNGLIDAQQELAKGMNFFSMFTDYLRTLAQQVNDWIAARDSERHDHIRYAEAVLFEYTIEADETSDIFGQQDVDTCKRHLF